MIRTGFFSGSFDPMTNGHLDVIAQAPALCDRLVIGVGSNLLVRDGGIKGVVIRLPASFGKVEVKGNRVRAGAAALDTAVARAAEAWRQSTVALANA